MAGATLLVVESPAKARTLKRILGPGFDVRATSGHVKDLPRGALGIDVEHGFAPRYDLVRGQARILSELKRAARAAGRVLLATDPDREGEAIAWHLAEELGSPGGDARVRRVLLDELTPEAVRRAVEHPADLDRRRFEAQQARRLLDRLVGFEASAVLWAGLRRGLSAGRVQSVALRVVVERERAIEAFGRAPAFTLRAELHAAGGPPVVARLHRLDGRAPRLRSAAEAEALAAGFRGRDFRVAAVRREERERPPPPPFTTATLQQEAWRRLGLSPRRTMALAQRLYEGVELGEEGLAGLLSYPRTDSERLSEAAVEGARAEVVRAHGAGRLPAVAPATPPPGPAARGAHEAIRPVSLDRPPEAVRPLLSGPGSRDLGRLYALVWRRTVASQMRPAVVELTEVEVVAGGAAFRAAGATVREEGWLAAHGGAALSDEAGAAPLEAALDAGPLPELAPGRPLRLAGLSPLDASQGPPPRFDEASLVRELAALGLGRPSTFAAIVDALQERGYVERAGRALRPTALGRRAVDVLARAFPRELEVAFTAGLEADLDRIEAGTVSWQEVLAAFHGPFRAAADGAARRARSAAPEQGPPCPRCGRPTVARWGRHGEFLSCAGYPACRHASPLRREDGALLAAPPGEPFPGEACRGCGGPLVLRTGRFGRWLACARPAGCEGRRPVPTGVACPAGCGGRLVERRSRQGRTFFGCERWPACDAVSWDRPLPEPCPSCGGGWLVERTAPGDGKVVACPDPRCGWRRRAAPPAA